MINTMWNGVSKGFYNEGHGIYLPTAKFGINSLYAFLIMTGSNVKNEYELQGHIWLIDIALTLAFLIRFPPRNCEGAIILDALDEGFLNKTFSCNI